jgi:hypothetical protein
MDKRKGTSAKGIAPAFKKFASERDQKSKPTQVMKLDAVAKVKGAKHGKK